MHQDTVMNVVAAAVVRDGRLLVVSKEAAPDAVERLAVVEDVAALEGVPMRMVVFAATLSGAPAVAAELAALRWTDGRDGVRLAPAVGGQVVPLLRERGWLQPDQALRGD
ncbi:NUDIX domain-containing protein [Streptomyces sp. NPDC051684]|uniref:NUDIX domain-containing protein n=1 Tax=Streptomyces sp. NPDC051684 TaxID=3365670 RepID=UPI00378BE5DE